MVASFPAATSLWSITPETGVTQLPPGSTEFRSDVRSVLVCNLAQGRCVVQVTVNTVHVYSADLTRLSTGAGDDVVRGVLGDGEAGHVGESTRIVEGGGALTEGGKPRKSFVSAENCGNYLLLGVDTGELVLLWLDGDGELSLHDEGTRAV